MARKRHLDKVNPLELASAINPDLADAVQQAQTRLQGEIKPAENTNFITNWLNQYTREAKHDIRKRNILKGKHVLPAIAAASLIPSALKGLVTPYISAYASSGLPGIGITAVRNGIEDVVGGTIANQLTKPFTKNLDTDVKNVVTPALFGLGSAGSRYYLDNAERRAIETVMRTSSSFDGLHSLTHGVNRLVRNKDYDRLKAIGKYIITGRHNTPNGYYNSLASDPEFNYAGAFSPLFSEDDNFIGGLDYISAFLYKKPITNLKLLSKGKNFGIHDSYIRRNYPTKLKDIPVYEGYAGNPSNHISEYRQSFVQPDRVYNSKDVFGQEPIVDKFGNEINIAGHKIQTGHIDNTDVYRPQDVWKFNPRDYMSKWVIDAEDVDYKTFPILSYLGLHEVDRLGTPIITTTPWKIGTISGVCTFETTKPISLKNIK